MKNCEKKMCFSNMIKIICECNSNIDNDDNDGNERGNTIKTQFQLCNHKVV